MHRRNQSCFFEISAEFQYCNIAMISLGSSGVTLNSCALNWTSRAGGAEHDSRPCAHTSRVS